MPSLEDAILLATEAHRGQKDKAGVPYILHPLRVMLRMETEADRIVAVLHDVVEDSGVTVSDLQKAGYSAEIVEAIQYQSERGRIRPVYRAGKTEHSGCQNKDCRSRR